MTALRFTTQPPAIQVNPNRSDVACFVGFVRRRDTAVPGVIANFLTAHGYTITPDLLDLPVPVDSWAVFQQLFSTERSIAPNTVLRATGYLSAAVRSFFAQGGRRCYIIRIGDPYPIDTDRAAKAGFLRRLIPGYSVGRIASTPSDRTTWTSVAHLFGLEDVSFLCLPDLSDLVAADPKKLPNLEEIQRSPEKFTACSAPQAAPPDDQRLQGLPAPRCDRKGYRRWAKALNLVANLLARHSAALRLRPIQLVAAIPLPEDESTAQANLLTYLERTGPLAALTAGLDDTRRGGLVSRSVQLTYPWIRSGGRTGLPEGLESPDGVLAGLLARNALSQGTYRSAASLPLAETVEVAPVLGRSQLYQTSHRGKSLIERVSLFGPTPTGTQLLSDVTTSLDETVRPASVHRLIGVIIRAARQLGQAYVFEPSGPHVWSQLTESLRGLMNQLYVAGALRGASAEDAFEVRCDRTTMTQADIDNGRLIARIDFVAALPIERISVTLTVSELTSGLLPVVITHQEAA